jgi:hypothetical protein
VPIGLTGRILILVIFAVVPALVIQAWNEYDLRIAREGDIASKSCRPPNNSAKKSVNCVKVLANCF